MKALIFVDYHNHHYNLPLLAKKAEEADIIICAGDFTIFEMDMELTLRAFEEWGKPIYLIHGNHEEEEALKTICERLKHTFFIHNKELDVNGVRLIGWGGGGFNTHDKGLEIARNGWRASEQKTILVTHAPPYGTTLDDIGRHVGNKTIRDVIETLQPDYCIAGHIHETAGAQDNIGKTTIINPGAAGKIITI